MKQHICALLQQLQLIVFLVHCSFLQMDIIAFKLKLMKTMSNKKREPIWHKKNTMFCLLHWQIILECTFAYEITWNWHNIHDGSSNDCIIISTSTILAHIVCHWSAILSNCQCSIVAIFDIGGYTRHQCHIGEAYHPNTAFVASDLILSHCSIDPHLNWNVSYWKVWSVIITDPLFWWIIKWTFWNSLLVFMGLTRSNLL